MNEKIVFKFWKEKKIWEFFGGGYDKPGKGVDKNEPKKRKAFFLVF